MKIEILSVGKNKETWLQEALDIYTTRLKGKIALEWRLARQQEQLEKWMADYPLLICLDPQGIALSSETFATQLRYTLEKGGSHASFAIGGADGFSNQAKTSKTLWSLSPLTFTHQITRLILVEQIFRSWEIWQGSAYHR